MGEPEYKNFIVTTDSIVVAQRGGVSPDVTITVTRIVPNTPRGRTLRFKLLKPQQNETEPQNERD